MVVLEAASPVSTVKVLLLGTVAIVCSLLIFAAATPPTSAAPDKVTLSPTTAPCPPLSVIVITLEVFVTDIGLDKRVSVLLVASSRGIALVDVPLLSSQ